MANALGGKSSAGLVRSGSSRRATLYHIKQLRTRHSGAHHLKRTSLTVNAFMSTKQDTVKLPIDFYALLQINPGVSRESVSRAYER